MEGKKGKAFSICNFNIHGGGTGDSVISKLHDSSSIRAEAKGNADIKSVRVMHIRIKKSGEGYGCELKPMESRGLPWPSAVRMRFERYRREKWPTSKSLFPKSTRFSQAADSYPRPTLVQCQARCCPPYWCEKAMSPTGVTSTDLSPSITVGSCVPSDET